MEIPIKLPMCELTPFLTPHICCLNCHVLRLLLPLFFVSATENGPIFGDGSKPCYLVNPKIAGKWMFIPLKMVLIGIDPYPFFRPHFGHLALRQGRLALQLRDARLRRQAALRQTQRGA